MVRLTYKNPNGKWGLMNGYDIQKVPRELYGALCKLKDYEEAEFKIEEAECINKFFNSQTAKVLAALQEYRIVGLSLEQLMLIDGLFLEKCKEVNKLTKEIEHLKVKIENLEQAQ